MKINTLRNTFYPLIAFLIFMWSNAQDTIQKASDNIQIPEAKSSQNQHLEGNNIGLMVMLVIIILLLVIWVFMRAQSKKRQHSYRNIFNRK